MPRLKYHQLAPIPRRVEDYERIEDRLISLLRTEVYLPLMRELGAGHLSLRNAYDDLVEAVMSGVIQYVDGHFEGRFNAAVSAEIRRLGGEWNRSRSWWALPSNRLPVDLRSAIGASRSKFEEMARRTDQRLEDVLAELRDPNGGWISGDAVQGERAVKIAEGRMRLTRVFDDTIYRADKDFQKNVAKVTVSPVLTREARARIAREYSENLSTHIRDLVKHQVLELRTEVTRAAVAGVRYESLVKTIQDSYGATLSHAKFLARQETSMLMSKFKQVRYTESGLPEYRWLCVHMPKDTSPDRHTLGNVRYYHGLLDGKVWRWDTGAPINARGERKNPGQDYRCRCNGAPVVRF